MTTTPILYELLLQLKKKELRQLKKFLRSPFVTHREDIGLMYNCLAECLYKGRSLPEKEALFTKVYVGESFDEQKLRSTMSELHLFVEQYLMWQSMQQEKTTSLLALAGFYRQRNLAKHFGRTIRKVQSMQKNQPLRNPDFYQNLLRFQTEKAQFYSANKRTRNLNLQEISNTMDILYLSQKLRHVCTQLSHRAVFQTNYELGLLQDSIDLLEESPFLEVPAIALYYYCYRFLTEAYSQVYFRKFREALSQDQGQFPKEELKDLYRAAINFCIRKLNEGSLEFTREGWELFQEGLAAGFFVENNQLSRFTFDNVVGFGLRLKEYSAVESFIAEYQNKLDQEYQQNTVLFNRARLEYERQNYEVALRYLQASDPNDLVNQLISKTLLLKIYFELDEFNLLDSHLDSFRSFIRRREVSDYHRQNFQNIIYYTRKIVALAPYSRPEREKLATAIQEEKVLTEKGWLLGKLSKKG